MAKRRSEYATYCSRRRIAWNRRRRRNFERTWRPVGDASPPDDEARSEFHSMISRRVISRIISG